MPVFFLKVTFGANLSPVCIRSSPQHVRVPHVVFVMTAQAPDSAVIERKRKIRRISRDKIRRVVVFPVIMADETACRQVRP
jgi:hypothetical protein